MKLRMDHAENENGTKTVRLSACAGDVAITTATTDAL